MKVINFIFFENIIFWTIINSLINRHMLKLPLNIDYNIYSFLFSLSTPPIKLGGVALTENPRKDIVFRFIIE